MKQKAVNTVLYLILFSSCLFDSEFKKIDKNFKFGYVNSTDNRNVYFRNQGIFYDEYVTAINWNDSFIVVRTKKKDFSRLKGYYIINKRKYLDDCYNNGVQNVAIEFLKSQDMFLKKMQSSRNLR